jgi:hypothetical protein
MSDSRAWALDISMVSDFSLEGSGPVRLSVPSVLQIAPQALIALMDKGRCCGLATVDGSALIVLPVSFEPNLLVSPMYEPLELQAEDRAKLFGRDEAHLRRILSSSELSPTAHAIKTQLPTAAMHARYWKVAPGRNGIAWPEWRQRGIAAIGWPDLGDISTLSASDFQTLSKAKYNKSKRSEGPYQVWLFRAIQPGDRVIANDGRTSILGVGTVTEGYRYQPGEHTVGGEDFPHQIRVKWDDTTARDIEDQADWTRTLRELPQEKFETLVGGSGAVPFSVTDPSNIILYGPPGTGKTYNVRRRALKLLGDATAADAPNDHVQAEWERLRQAGRIVFCTFHPGLRLRGVRRRPARDHRRGWRRPLPGRARHLQADRRHGGAAAQGRLRPRHRRDQPRQHRARLWRADHAARTRQAARQSERAARAAPVVEGVVRRASEPACRRHHEHRRPLHRADGRGAAPPVYLRGDNA